MSNHEWTLWKVTEGLLMAYCVEKLDTSWNSIKFGELDHSNPLILLSRVSAETPENRRKGVFQHNRPISEIFGAKRPN